MIQLLPRGPVIFGPDGRPVPRLRAISQLPEEPDRSDIEMLVDSSNPPVLTEDADRTLNGIFESTVRFINGTTAQLTNIWRTRRSEPDLLHQPPQQWPTGPSTEATGFAGYLPRSVAYNPNQFRLNAQTFRRLKAAAVEDDARQKWATFD